MEPTPSYVVVARRYRPQRFSELVGQEHVSRALANAITSQRVGHAYLFTGARGVGKTSAARILAKSLNCVRGPTPDPCNACDICQAISTGDDVDVLEIDGASNRGIDEIRQLRQNVSIRPSRSRYKIYIIDEVHMLTREAFNALLKTLEEPPEHVKFIFCTTEPEKLPVTVISRCQRFDFAGIPMRAIVERLRQIVEAEGVAAEPAALEFLARRAAGSMRDSQSLLEQLLAFGGQPITVADVHRMLGTAADSRVADIVAAIVGRDTAGMLTALDETLGAGVDVGQLVDQVLGYLRDVLVAAAGAPATAMLFTNPSEAATVAQQAQSLGIETTLAAMQILDHALGRMRVSTHRRTLAEIALVRISRLENLEAISALIGLLREGTAPQPGGTGAARPVPPLRPPAREPIREAPAPVTAAKEASLPDATARESGAASLPPSKSTPPPVTPVPPAASKKNGAPGSDEPGAGEGLPEPVPAGTAATQAANDGPVERGAAATPKATVEPPRYLLTPDNATEVWRQVVSNIGDMASEMAAMAASVAIPAPNHLVVRLADKYSANRALCERPEQIKKFEEALASATGQAVRVSFQVETPPASASPAEPRGVQMRERQREAYEHPLVRRAAELFKARPVRYEEPPQAT
jgi:DNA polymerase-3 subunit gamma/tau